jgi:c-di-GMP-related signal transduction protein
MASRKILLRRQPIFRADLEVIGYEILLEGEVFRTTSLSVGDDETTAEALVGSVGIGLERLVGDKLIFVDASRSVFTRALPILLPPHQTVLEYLEPVGLDQAVLEGCASLVADGYRIAIDDFAWFRGMEKLLVMASVVKVDVGLMKDAVAHRLVELCREFKVDLVAKEVESRERMETCRDLGFDYFQGDMLLRPEVVSGRVLEPSKHARIALSVKLVRPEASLDEIAGLIQTDPALSHRVLQIAAIGSDRGMGGTVRSVRDALVITGVRRLQAWATLALLAERESTGDETLMAALLRARMTELLAAPISAQLGDAGFTVGLVSCFDVLLGISLEEALSSLPLEDDLRGAILHHEGVLGAILADAIAYQLGEKDHLSGSHVSDSTLRAAYVDALLWGTEMLGPTFLAGQGPLIRATQTP